jgi:hypothetical protein
VQRALSRCPFLAVLVAGAAERSANGAREPTAVAAMRYHSTGSHRGIGGTYGSRGQLQLLLEQLQPCTLRRYRLLRLQ